MNLKQFDIMLDSKLFIIGLYLIFVFLLCFFFSFLFFFAVAEKQRLPMRVVVLLNPSILLGKKSAASRNKYLIYSVLVLLLMKILKLFI